MSARLAALLAVLLSVVPAGAQSLRQDLRSYCWPAAGKMVAVPSFARAGEDGRQALLELARATAWPDADCGIGALSMLGDERVVPALVSRLQRADTPRNPHADLLSWAVQLTAISEVRSERTQLVRAVTRHLAGTHGTMAAAVLGLLDDPDARAAIDRELASTSPDRRAHGIFAAALQRDATAMDIVRRASLDQNFQSARRRQWLALYYLTSDAKTVLDGLAIMDDLPPFTRDAIARWATQTLCIRSGRGPRLEGLEAHRRQLVREFTARKLDFSSGPYIICTDIQ